APLPRVDQRLPGLRRARHPGPREDAADATVACSRRMLPHAGRNAAPVRAGATASIEAQADVGVASIRTGRPTAGVGANPAPTPSGLVNGRSRPDAAPEALTPRPNPLTFSRAVPRSGGRPGAFRGNPSSYP